MAVKSGSAANKRMGESAIQGLDNFLDFLLDLERTQEPQILQKRDILYAFIELFEIAQEESMQGLF